MGPVAGVLLSVKQKVSQKLSRLAFVFCQNWVPWSLWRLATRAGAHILRELQMVVVYPVEVELFLLTCNMLSK